MTESDSSNAEAGGFFKLKSRSVEFTIVGVLLLLHFSLVFTASQRKSPVFDESVHIAGGLSYWLKNDYRINPENGNFPQRWAAVPLIFQKLKFDGTSDFIFRSGNNPEKILMFSRAMITILSLATGLAVYFYSRKIFGTGGGLLSLVLYILCPEILAHAGFATSDMAVAMAFTLALICIWNVLDRITVRNIIFSSLALSILFVSKFSAFIIIPVYLILIFIRLRNGKHVECVIFSRKIPNDTQAKQLLSYSAVLLVNLIFVLFFIWMSYGFRFSIINAPETADRTALDKIIEYKSESTGATGNALLAVKKMKLLPEAYLYGLTLVLKGSSARNSYLNGELSTLGWWYFFIYSFMVKTPVPLILIFAISLFALFKTRILPNDRFYMLTPFLVFILIYFLFAISSRMNIGNRHLLPIYPCISIICGSAYLLLRSKLPVAILTAFLIAWFAVESYKIRPHYLSYFNQLAGGSENGYKHLSDSSLDWGQDLKELRKWIDRNNQKNEVVYLSYFGTADISHYMRDYRQLPCFFEQENRADDFFELKGGIYCISATMFQFTYYSPGLKKATGLNSADISEDMFIDISSEMKNFNEGKIDLSNTGQDP
ncbi:MAG: glycosyltransferase family 39 protein, partial [Lentisphaerae bacterium]|nr:glycosyltransferase family 39 protein [Lentisphaerota bacterium]